ncbi:MAG: muconolactone Delta-isomerase family protein [Corynebacterium sp.]|uniref:muconolactone Delta-isomerase family protein n=1 Tax=Corynebacterium sp. TaxID=1720 RepID=UPI0026DF399E|nr:muconolactone Delta-isomerase family protein [Corynebacterium sp.]MDO5671136.1 muconolactone Delta-isomerase family protein [Corynebacterium sp.]
MQWLVRLRADVPLDMDPEVRADLFQRTRDLVSGWPGEVWRVAGGWTVVAVLSVEDPHELIAALPLHPWLTVTVEPLVSY